MITFIRAMLTEHPEDREFLWKSLKHQWNEATVPKAQFAQMFDMLSGLVEMTDAPEPVKLLYRTRLKKCYSQRVKPLLDKYEGDFVPVAAGNVISQAVFGLYLLDLDREDFPIDSVNKEPFTIKSGVLNLYALVSDWMVRSQDEALEGLPRKKQQDQVKDLLFKIRKFEQRGETRVNHPLKGLLELYEKNLVPVGKPLKDIKDRITGKGRGRRGDPDRDRALAQLFEEKAKAKPHLSSYSIARLVTEHWKALPGNEKSNLSERTVIELIKKNRRN